jgi:hypothetical protein
MPFTLLAHQAPVLPLAGRRRLDGLALVVGSMAPDLMAVTGGWGYAGAGVPLYLDGHRVQNQLLVALVAVAVTAVVRVAVVPVLPRLVGARAGSVLDDLFAPPSAGPRWWWTFASAVIGAATHLALDALTHSQGRPVWWLQIGLSVALALVTIGWFRRRVSARAPGGPGPDPVAGAVGAVWGAARVGGHDYYGHEIRIGTGTGLMTVAWVVLGGLVVACAALRAHQPRSIHSWR